MQYSILITKSEKDYELIDSGNGEKLERYGSVILSRPDPQALWLKKITPEIWDKSDAHFVKKGSKNQWKIKEGVPKKWQIDFSGLKFWIRPTSFKHTGLFPEQSSNWKWIESTIVKSQRKVTVLNLFGYTGGATLAALKAGAEVCHVDGSKVAITWAKDNSEISGLGGKPVRWILDDALAFVKREVKRGNKYDAIVMDPPAFGRGPEGEVWKIEENFLELIEECRKILTEKPLFFIINGYSSGYSALAYKNIMNGIVEKYGGNIEFGELTIEESVSQRLLPSGIFSRWSSI